MEMVNIWASESYFKPEVLEQLYYFDLISYLSPTKTILYHGCKSRQKRFFIMVVKAACPRKNEEIRVRPRYLISYSASYMRQWIGSALVQIMACRLSGAKPLSSPVLGYCQLDPGEQTSVKFS